MDSARFLLERLNWPVRLARLQAAREYANLFADPSFGAVALQMYLTWLSERQTENEVCSGLAVLLAASTNYLPGVDVLSKNLPCPSILADYMLKEIYGPAAPSGSWASRHSGRAPPSFEPGEYFLRHQRDQIPPSLAAELLRLERLSGLPFLKQWAFEWEHTKTSTDAPLSGFPYHFLEAALEQSGVSAQLDQRQGDIYRSAYLRTLHCAVDIWRMPLEEACEAATKCLPLNRGLVDIGPVDRPHWLGELPDECAPDNAPLKSIMKEILKAATKSDGLVPVHLRTPLSLKISEFSSLTLSCALLSEDFVPVPDTDIADLRTTAWDLPTGSLFAGQPRQLGVDDYAPPTSRGTRLPFCVDIFPFPFGYWMGDLFHLGLSLPASYAFNEVISYHCRGGGILTEMNGQTIGRWTTWNDHWTYLYPKGGNTRCGSVSEMRPVDIITAADRFGLKVGWTADVKIWCREKSYDELKLIQKSTFLFDDGEIVR
ncbi:hypothetical protein [Rhizobium lentis]|uniref:Uncharacterized protein n=1 Tax=Rhizobium lentis TaxID=1138194 RepID=A0A7W9CWI3_9HYPH|nr:hypothetical protein [Rhizobium lentis]MBB4575963.1 hypothetical protein [Rhizobium lentis]MBB5551974.1 hypothetical protein [Rhizobium lentis]MBB5562512.1 hypothetical protein [Rhizobium lentis]MBB5569941.1 hypothetical protein [Rhizobium lentis]